MRYYKKTMFEQTIYVFEANPSEGELVAHTEQNLAKVEDINHNWFEDRPQWNKIAAINCSFFNGDGSRNGSSMEDSVWNGTPYVDDPWIEAIWDGELLSIRDLEPMDLINLKANFVKGVLPLLRDGKKDVSKKQVATYAPRTSFGQKSNGDIVFMVTDGRPYNLSFDQTCEVMLSLGCVNAVMADGGGSSTLCINNKMVNNNENRLVRDALIFYSKDKLEIQEEEKVSEFTCIFPTISERITSPYGKRSIGDGFHDGIDIGAVVPGDNDPIFAAHDGTVAMSYFSKSYGNCIIINDSKTKYSTLYGHLAKRYVSVGDVVEQGKPIGLMGTTGNSTGIHLHFEVRNRHYDSKYWNSHDGEFYSSYDPMDFIVEDEPEEEAQADSTLKDNLTDVYERIEADMADFKALIDSL